MSASPPARISITAIRDFRVSPPPVGYVTVLAKDYYAYWSHLDGGYLHIQSAAKLDEAWMDLSLQLNDSGLLPLAMKVQAIENWGGEKVERESFTLRFADASGHGLSVTFYADRIELMPELPDSAGLETIAFCKGTRVFGKETMSGNPESHGVGQQPLSRALHIRPDWFTPPPYAFALETASGRWATAALEMPAGEMPYRFFDQTPEVDTLSWQVRYLPALPQGKTLPQLTLRFGADSPLQAFSDYAKGYRSQCGLPERPTRESADWWRGPMLCGWHEQVRAAQSEYKNPELACNQVVYDRLLQKVDATQVPWQILTIDAGWSEAHAIWMADSDKWPDLRAWIDGYHQQGKRVLLWICTNPFGLPDDETLLSEGRRYLDPKNTKWLERVRQQMQHMLGAGEGELNADGIKFDYTDQVPRHFPQESENPSIGLDYLYALLQGVTEAAKAVKPDALMDLQVAHPLFAEFTDMVRLNDYFLPPELARHTMGHRSRLARSVSPGSLVDTDGPVGADWYRQCAEYGNPSFYITLDHLDDPKLVAAMQQAGK